ncbi:MAG: hypothetical protein ACRYFX_29205 [Janthinobacterium lividum]
MTPPLPAPVRPAARSLPALPTTGNGVAASAPGCYTIAEAVRTLRDSLIVGGHLKLADSNQQQCLIRLYNSALASRDEKQAMLLELPSLYVDEVGQRYKAFKAVLEQREVERRQGTYRVVGMAELVRPQAA